VASASDHPEQGERRRPSVVVEVDAASFVEIIGALLLALGVIAIFRSAPSTMTKLGIGVLLALALDPVVTMLQNRFHWSRAVAVAAVSAVLTTALTGVVLLLGPAAIDEARRFTRDIPATVKEFYSWPIIGERLRDADAAGDVATWIENLPTRFDDDTIGNTLESILGGVATMSIVLVSAIAVMVDGEALVARTRRLFTPRRRERVDRAGRIIYETIGRYFAGSLFVAVMNGLVIMTAGLLLGVPLAPLAGVWSMITNLIPQIGGFLGGGFFVLLAFSESPLVGAIALVVFLGYQQLENNVIGPAIVGRAVDLSPPTTMLAALIGGAAAGVPGALAATPLVGASKALFLWLRRGEEPDADPLPVPRIGHVRGLMNRLRHRGA
jgi:putative heme transporter